MRAFSIQTLGSHRLVVEQECSVDSSATHQPVKVSHVEAGQGWRCIETQHSVAIPKQRRRTRRRFDAIRTINEEGFDHGQAREFKYSAVDRIEDRLNGPIDALVRINRLGRAQGHRAHGALGGKDATVEPSSSTIDSADREYPVDPALHYGGHSKPPNRKLEYHD